MDYFAKWCETVSLAHINDLAVSDAIVNHWIPRWESPWQIHSDRSTSFENDLVLELYRAVGIEKTRSAACHSLRNGLVEKTNGSLKAFAHRNISNWSSLLAKDLIACQNTVHSGTDHTTYLVWSGREVRLPSVTCLQLAQRPRLQIAGYASEHLDAIREAR